MRLALGTKRQNNHTGVGDNQVASAAVLEESLDADLLVAYTDLSVPPLAHPVLTVEGGGLRPRPNGEHEEGLANTPELSSVGLNARRERPPRCASEHRRDHVTSHHTGGEQVVLLQPKLLLRAPASHIGGEVIARIGLTSLSTLYSCLQVGLLLRQGLVLQVQTKAEDRFSLVQAVRIASWVAAKLPFLVPLLLQECAGLYSVLYVLCAFDTRGLGPLGWAVCFVLILTRSRSGGTGASVPPRADGGRIGSRGR